MRDAEKVREAAGVVAGKKGRKEEEEADKGWEVGPGVEKGRSPPGPGVTEKGRVVAG
jgi:hypothetical protein